VVSLGALAIHVLPSQDAGPPGVATRLTSGLPKARGKTRRSVKASPRKSLPVTGVRAGGRASLAGREGHKLWRGQERPLAENDGAKGEPGAIGGVHEETQATRCTKARRMAQGAKICKDAAPMLRCEERAGSAEARPRGAGIGDSPRIGIEGVLCEGGLRGALKRVEEGAAPRPEDECGAREGKEEIEAKGRRDERVVLARLENAQGVKARRAKKCAKRSRDGVRSLHACGP
jgi:hypothetical protein